MANLNCFMLPIRAFESASNNIGGDERGVWGGGLYASEIITCDLKSHMSIWSHSGMLTNLAIHPRILQNKDREAKLLKGERMGGGVKVLFWEFLRMPNWGNRKSCAIS